MYKIIGADGKVYGPVSAEQLRQWIKDGRANAQTQIQPEGAAEWKPLGALPEFAELLGSPAPSGGVPPTVAPPPITVNPDALAAEILARGYQVNIGDWIGRGWQLLTSNFWLFVGATFVAGLIAGMGIIGLVLGGPMIGGLYAMFLKKKRGQPVTFGDVFVGFNTFVPLMLARILMGVFGVLGLLFCLLPGIYLLVAWHFTLVLVIDKKLDFWPAMELSRKMVNKHWWGIFGFLIVCALINLGGLLVCCVGILVTAPIAYAASIYAYEDIFGNRA